MVPEHVVVSTKRANRTSNDPKVFATKYGKVNWNPKINVFLIPWTKQWHAYAQKFTWPRHEKPWNVWVDGLRMLRPNASKTDKRGNHELSANGQKIHVSDLRDNKIQKMRVVCVVGTRSAPSVARAPRVIKRNGARVCRCSIKRPQPY